MIEIEASVEDKVDGSLGGIEMIAEKGDGNAQNKGQHRQGDGVSFLRIGSTEYISEDEKSRIAIKQRIEEIDEEGCGKMDNGHYRSKKGDNAKKYPKTAS